MVSHRVLIAAASAASAFQGPKALVARPGASALGAASVAEWRAAADLRVVSYYDFGVRIHGEGAAGAPGGGGGGGVAEAEAPSAAYAAGEVFKYFSATAAQYGLVLGALSAVDALPFALPKPCVWVAFAFLSLRSRIFSLLDNSRPDRDAQGGKATPSDVVRPKWTPPGIAFPFIWLTITALRATAAALAYGGTLRAAPLEALVLHLCVGDTWNTITNVERRLGVSAVGCLAVWASVLAACRAFRASAAPVAGLVLAPSLAWISVACVLTANIWWLNGKRPLYPTPGDGESAKTKLAFLLQFQPGSIGGK